MKFRALLIGFLQGTLLHGMVTSLCLLFFFGGSHIQPKMLQPASVIQAEICWARDITLSLVSAGVAQCQCSINIQDFEVALSDLPNLTNQTNNAFSG